MTKTLQLSLSLTVAVIGLLLLNPRAHSDPAFPSDSLYKTIQSLDTRLFDAYNNCDLPTISSLVAEDLEF
jgi:hypothetical protein